MSEIQAEAILRDHYGVEAHAAPLRSERDSNFLMNSATHPRMTMKFCNPSQDPRLALFHTRALTHIAAVDPDLRVPRIVVSTSGAARFSWSGASEGNPVGYVLTYLDGTPLADRPRTPELAASMGAMAARLGRALRGFFDPSAGHELLWDLKHAAGIGDLLPSGCRDYAVIAAAIERFRSDVAPRLPALRAQVIHNDLNPHNMLVDPAQPDRLSGIIDFGDMVHSALVGDVAVAAAYLIEPEPDPFGLMAAFVAAYHAVTPLEADEIALLPDLIATRHAMTCAISAWRADRYPENAAYILRHAEGAARGLASLSGAGRAELGGLLAAACAIRPA